VRPVGAADTLQRAGVVTDLIEIRYHTCPSGSPGRTWWPQIILEDGVHAVFCPEVVHPVTKGETIRIIIEADISQETAEQIQLFLNDRNPDPDAGFAFHTGHGGHGADTAITVDSVQFRS
jgi:hypothetical protein